MMFLLNDMPKVKPIDKKLWQEVKDRFDLLIKPVGSLARLEDITCLYAAAQKSTKVELKKKSLLLFASDYSQEDSELTMEAFQQIAEKSHTISTVAEFFKVEVELLELGLFKNLPENLKNYSKHITSATEKVAKGEAISEEEFTEAFNLGKEFAKNAIDKGATVLALAYIGAGSEVNYSAFIAKLFNLSVGEEIILEEKAKKLLAKIASDNLEPINLAIKLTGTEIPAMMGAIIYAASVGVPVFLDGIATLLAAYLAIDVDENVKDYLVAVCTTTESGQDILLTKLLLSTMLDLKLEISCGAGSMFGFNLLEAGIRALNEMDSFGAVHFPLGDIK